MNCEKFMSMLDRYADLTELELAQLEEHSQNCDNCRAELEFMRSIIGTAQSLPPIEPPQDFLETLNSRLDKELAAEPKIVYFMRHAKPYINRYGTIAACLAIGIAIGANGNMLVSRMNDDNDGVISSTTVVTDDGTTPVAENAVEPQIETAETEPVPQAREEQTVIAASSDKAATATKPTINVNTNIITEQSAPVNEVKETATAKPVEPTATMVAPVVTAVPEVVSDAADEVQSEVSEGDNAGIMVASLDAEQPDVPVGYSVRMIEEPEETPEVYAAAEEDVAAEYSIATMQPMDETAYVAPLSSTIMVNEADAERVKEIIMELVEATYGNYYMMTGDKLYSLALRLESEGIWYYANLTDTGEKVSFKLVIK